MTSPWGVPAQLSRVDKHRTTWMKRRWRVEATYSVYGLFCSQTGPDTTRIFALQMFDMRAVAA